MNRNLKNKTEWQQIQDKLADKKGLAIVLKEDEGLSDIHSSNNNSICRHLTSSEEFAPQCKKFCGEVYTKAIRENKALRYKCHAGLECVAVPVIDSKGKKLVAISGRAFTKSADYRNATERAISGDWSKFPPSKFFENILMTSSNQNIKDLAELILKKSEKHRIELSEIKKNKLPKIENKKKKQDNIYKKDLSKVIDKLNQQTEKHNLFIEKITKTRSEDSKDLKDWRSLFSSLLDLEYKQACLKIIEFLRDRYGLNSMAWLESRQNALERISAIGELEKQAFQISLKVNDNRLLNAVKENSSVILRERAKPGTKNNREQQVIRLFPVTVGGKTAECIGYYRKNKR